MFSNTAVKTPNVAGSNASDSKEAENFLTKKSPIDYGDVTTALFPKCDKRAITGTPTTVY
jgi:hypothetical protein